MKKRNFKILMGVIFIFLIINIFPVLSKAASFKPTISSTSVNVGDTITIALKADNAAGMYKVSASNSNVTLISGNEIEFLENTTTTLKYKANKPGTVTITASATDMSDLNDSSKKVTGGQTFTITIKEKETNNGSSSGSSSNGNTGSSSGNNNTKTPTFKSVNQKVYTTGDPTTNLRASWSTNSQATSVPKGTELTLTGTSTETIEGYTWYRVTYQGATKYIASSLITYTKPKEDDKDDDKKDEKDEKEKSTNKNLSSLKIEGIEISPTFSKEITQYTAHVDGDVTELKIDAKAEDSKAKINIEGNKALKEGDNIIKVKVTAEDETTRTYFITVTKGEGTVTDTKLKLAELKIDRVNFESTFKPEIYSYDLNLTSFVDKLDITATPNQADATVEITGNQDFKEGENIIIILLTSADGEETANYQIKVNIPEEVVEAKKEELDIKFYILAGIAVVVVLVAVILIIRRRLSRDDDYAEDEDIELEQTEKIGNRRFSNYESVYEEDTKDKSERENQQERKSEERSSRDATLDEFLNGPDDDDDDREKRTRGGRHSR